MVWAGISATAMTDLVFIDGNLIGQRHIDEVLTPHVLPFLHQMPVADPIFQDDNARPHRARRRLSPCSQCEPNGLARHVAGFVLY